MSAVEGAGNINERNDGNVLALLYMLAVRQ